MSKIALKALCLSFSIPLSHIVNADLSPKQAQAMLWLLSPQLVKQGEKEFKTLSFLFGTLCGIGALKTTYETTKFSKKVFRSNRDADVSIQKSLGCASISAVPGFLLAAFLAYIAKDSFMAASDGLYTELPNWMKS